jgi:hypothetical protein
MPNNLGQLSDRELLAELRIYNNAAMAAPADFGLTAAEAAALQGDLENFENSLDEWDAVNAQYDSKLEAKNAAREQALTRGRGQRRITRAHTGISNELLASAGLAPYDDVKTASASPTSAPVAMVDFGKLRHTVNFRDTAMPDSIKKPDGILGAEIWLKIGGEAPVDNKECQYLATDTATPYLNTFGAADAGKTAWYLLRWVSKNGDKGDWSEAVSATING